MKEGILFLNPGSTMLPRGGKEPTYAVVDWDETAKYYVQKHGSMKQ